VIKTNMMCTAASRPTMASAARTVMAQGGAAQFFRHVLSSCKASPEGFSYPEGRCPSLPCKSEELVFACLLRGMGSRLGFGRCQNVLMPLTSQVFRKASAPPGLEATCRRAGDGRSGGLELRIQESCSAVSITTLRQYKAYAAGLLRCLGHSRV
jgi:hypothetical protein